MKMDKKTPVHDVREILVIRPLRNMVLAVSTQNINITAYEYTNDLIHLTPENVKADVKLTSNEFPNRTFRDGLKGIYTLYNIIYSLKPDVVHVNALQDLAFVSIAARLCALKGHRPAIIGMSHNPLTWNNSRRARTKALLIKYLTDGFVALATTHKNLLVRLGVPANRIAVIPNPYNDIFLEYVKPGEEKKQNSVFRVTYIAHICQRKAQDVLIHAASEVLKRYPNCRFEIVGKIWPGEEPYVEKLHSLIKMYCIEDSIHFLGEVPHHEVLSLLQKSDIVVFPTLAEMMPRAVIEAMAIGKPVIASGVDGILDLIQNRKTGILVEPGKFAELALAILELIENPDLADSLGSTGQKYILDYCSPERVGKEFKIFYTDILNRIM